MNTNNRRAFTLVELLTVMAIIAILAGLILSTYGYIQRKAASSRAESEIAAISAACESYKADNGIYPRGKTTDTLDPKATGSYNPSGYKTAGLVLYRALSGDTDLNRLVDDVNDPKKDIEGNPVSGTNLPKPKIYFEFKPGNLEPSGSATVTALIDPFGYSYGYSTAYQADMEVQNAKNPPGQVTKGYNPTFDLWSTAGSTTAITSGTGAKWIKNW